ncbi:hypothetical protein RFN57_03910 [Streptomyces violaceochromogenes]|uniref:Uncharacterized protein n=1 Tax=Streptomyces violaceochromogenes TaxID=67377 RepID=A0ABU6LPK1_9ACTN|nr:hypothetical protein [Streptomyces violaceochromogenes]MEC7051437.1 hypothetical protein [Streptomyces violaceochromogenes]
MGRSATSIEETGPNTGEINWDSPSWPDPPELDFLGESKHAQVTLLPQHPHPRLDEPAEDHTVHVGSISVDGHQLREPYAHHLREPYAHWPAQQVGLTVTEPGQRSSSRPSALAECERRDTPKR